MGVYGCGKCTSGIFLIAGIDDNNRGLIACTMAGRDGGTGPNGPAVDRTTACSSLGCGVGVLPGTMRR